MAVDPDRERCEPRPARHSHAASRADLPMSGRLSPAGRSRQVPQDRGGEELTQARVRGHVEVDPVIAGGGHIRGGDEPDPSLTCHPANLFGQLVRAMWQMWVEIVAYEVAVRRCRVVHDRRADQDSEWD